MIKLIFCITIIGILILFESTAERIYFPGETTEDEIFPRIETSKDVGVVASPNFGEDWICGYVNRFPLVHNGFEIGPDGESIYRPIYYLNETAEKLEAEGFDIKVNEVGSGDVLCNFTFSNGSYQNTFAYRNIASVLPAGGKPAKVARSYYMAQIGEKNYGKISWLCDGVLINHRWILSAAHCFTNPGVDPNIVRLGDLNLSDPESGWREKEFIRDYPISHLVPHPRFKVNERYHDIVLIQIPRSIPLRSSNIFPICLPWDTETNKDLVGMNVTLTGWGATRYGGPKTPILQEVNLTVFDTLLCDEAYSGIPENERKYPQGITEDRLLCVGWEDDGKDACGGDSGAPIVYLKDDFDKSKLKGITITSGKLCGEYKSGIRYGLDAQDKRYVLAGIVSGGFGCGLKNFPGLYIPINKPMYLQWIKDVAFKDYV